MEVLGRSQYTHEGALEVPEDPHPRTQLLYIQSIKECSIIIQLLMLRTLADTQDLQHPQPLLLKEPPIFLAPAATQDNTVDGDVQLCKQLIEGLSNCQETLANKIQKIVEKVEERDYSKGMGYFNAKNLMFLEYLIQLQFYQLFKINAVDLTKGAGLDLYRRLVYLKTLLTKLGPIQKKLEYQKNKLLRLSDLVNVKSDQPQGIQQNEGLDKVEQSQNESQIQNDQQGADKYSQSDDDALAYQPRPQSLMAVKQKKQALLAKEGKYVAPKLSAALSKQDKMRRRQELQQERKKAHLIRKFRDDLADDEEARQQGVYNEVTEKIKRKFKEKTDIEEQNFIRFPENKKDKFWKKQLIQKFNKSDQLRDSLKEVEMIGQIYRNQVQQERQNDVVYNKKTERPKGINKMGNTGTKKQKRQ